MNHGFFRVAAAVPSVNVADFSYNSSQIVEMAKAAVDKGAQLVVFPELSVTAYTCADLFHSQTLLKAAEASVCDIAAQTKGINTTLFVIGAPLSHGTTLYNCAVFIFNGQVVGVVPKTYLPNYNEFYEKRWFQPAPEANGLKIKVGDAEVPFTASLVVEICGVKVGAEICEDLWSPLPPSTRLALSGAEVIVNLSASDDLIGKYSYLRSLIAQQSARCLAAYVYAGAGFGESSTDLTFDGKGIIAENGSILAEAKRWTGKPSLTLCDVDIDALRRDRMHLMTFSDTAARHALPEVVSVRLDAKEPADSELLRDVNAYPFVPSDKEKRDERCNEITNIQVAGLARRLAATHTTKLVIGISGGLDSTLALLVAAATFDRLGLSREGIVGVTMPGFGTTGRTYNNALTLMRTLGITIREIPIADAVNLHFRDIGHDPKTTDVTYENSQARERTQILMDIANQVGGMVLGTGDLSELALGWATYNGDHMSMYAVNAGVPKTLVRYLVGYFADSTENTEEHAALLDIVDTPISPELTPADEKGEIAQKTEDLVGPYELHDFFLYYVLRFGYSPAKIYYLATHAFPDREDEIKRWIKVFFRRFFNQQFKRSCLPDGPKVGSVCLSPRGDWRMPSDASSAQWLSEADRL